MQWKVLTCSLVVPFTGYVECLRATRALALGEVYQRAQPIAVIGAYSALSYHALDCACVMW